MLNLNQYPNADAAAIKLLKQLGANVNPQNVVGELEKHHDYPTDKNNSEIQPRSILTT